jgi:hypothetical protein
VLAACASDFAVTCAADADAAGTTNNQRTRLQQAAARAALRCSVHSSSRLMLCNFLLLKVSVTFLFFEIFSVFTHNESAMPKSV